MKSAFGLLMMILGILSGGAALVCIAIVAVFSDMRTLGAGGSGGATSDAVAIIAGFATAALLLWFGGRSMRRSAAAESRSNP
ncbi:hypothetical protein [Hypericibacter sp.]|uniref:hypothetical protein n=1 Tax=Hypericibacter sp. TaxID=2705401 RepID=UPI003D6C9E15